MISYFALYCNTVNLFKKSILIALYSEKEASSKYLPPFSKMLKQCGYVSII